MQFLSHSVRVQDSHILAEHLEVLYPPVFNALNDDVTPLEFRRYFEWRGNTVGCNVKRFDDV